MLFGATENEGRGQLPCRDEIHLGRFVIHVEADDPRVIESIWKSADREMCRRDSNLRDDDRFIHARLRLSSQARNRPADFPPSNQAAAVFESVELHASDREHLLVVDRKSIVAFNPTQGTADGYISPEHVESAWILAHRIFYLSVIELLRCHRAYYIHAGCVCDGDRGILVCAPSGGGKSTLTYALARGGFSYLSDDGVFVDKVTNGLEIFSFPEKIKLDSRSCSYFDELSHLGKTRGKREISLREARIRHVSNRARPVALIFPVRSDGRTSDIRRIARHEALVRVLGQSIPLLEPTGVPPHLETLTELVETCDCFELSAASDFDGIRDLVSNTVAGLA